MTKKKTNTINVSWATRKRLAINAFYAFLVYTLIYWFFVPLWMTYFGISVTWAAAIHESYSWFTMTVMGVVLGYMGFTTLPFIGKGKGIQVSSSSDDEGEKDKTDETGIDKYQGDTSEQYVDPNYKFNAKDL